MFASLFAVQMRVDSGSDCVPHITIPNQNAGYNWKLKMPPVPSCLGSDGGSLGRTKVNVAELPEPGVCE